MEKSMQVRRNASIDLWKFVYSWFVVYFHFYSATSIHFISGRYGVEFFLLVAGVYFFRAMEKNEGEPPRKHIAKRFWRFFPWSATAFISAFILIRIVIWDQSLKELIKGFSGDIWEFLMIKMNGMNRGRGLLNSPAWTLSSMLLVEIVMVGCYARDKKTFIQIVMPLSLIVGFGYWQNLDIASQQTWMGFTTFGTIRTWLVYICGYYCLQFSRYLRDIPLNRRAEAALTVLETLCHAFAICVMLRINTRYFQWCTLLAFFVATAISLSGHSLWNLALRRVSRITNWLGAISLSVYLIHRPITRYFEALYPDNSELYTHVAAVTVTIVCAALLHYFITNGLIKLWQRSVPKLKKMFFLSDCAGKVR